MQVAVIVKSFGDCTTAADGRHLTYFADEGRLPSTWAADGGWASAAAAPPNGVEIVESIPAERVDIHLHHASVTVSVRLVGRHYAVSVLLPDWHLTNRSQDISRRPNSSSELAAVQLCRTGCPGPEVVDLDLFFRQMAAASTSQEVKVRRATAARAGKAVLPFPVAVRACGEAVGLSGYFADSCVFDLLNTGDVSFAQLSARGAAADVRNFLGDDTEQSAFPSWPISTRRIGAMVAERLGEAEVTSSAGICPLVTTTCCRRLIIRLLPFITLVLYIGLFHMKIL